MIKIENTDVYGFEAAIRGCRNPLNSWNRSDSFSCEKYFNYDTGNCLGCPVEYPCDSQYDFHIGTNDLKLMRNLAKAGNDHAKFERMINVTCDITAPVYIWAEIDTYKIATVRNSCSFMHKGVSKPFELSDFSIESGNEEKFIPIIKQLNELRDEYLKTKDDSIFYVIRQLLPQGYNVRATWQANYQVLWNMYNARKNHRLPEWHEFCKWCESLPYFKEIFLFEE